MEETVHPPQAGPRVLGAVIDVAAGAYTSITEITAPSSAMAGDTVDIVVRVKNLATYGIYIAVTASYDGITIPITPDYASVNAGAIGVYNGSFTMPSYDVTIKVWSFYWTGTEWYQDDSDQVDVAMAVVYEGTINRKVLEHDSTYTNIPASNIPQNESGLVHIWGRNDTPTAQQLGISWTVTDPQGNTVETYSAWESWPYTGAGDDHEFIGGRFSLSKVGTYRIAVSLYMNPSNPQIVDSYSGTLCTVQQVIGPPEFQGFAISQYNRV